MIGYLLVILAQFFYALGALVLKRFLEKAPPLPIFLLSLGLSGALASFLLVLVIGRIISFPEIHLSFSDIKNLSSFKNIPHLFIYSFLFIFLGELFLIIGYLKGKSLLILSLSALFYPLFAALFSFFILKEELTFKLILGTILMIAGYILILI